MASGDPILEIIAVMPPVTLPAGLRFLAGASTPAESIPLLLFDDATIEYVDFLCRLSVKYAGGGITLSLLWSATSATSNNCIWQAAFRDLPDDAEDLDTTAFTYDYNTVTAAAPSAVGEQSYDTITFTDGADMDSTPAGDYCILRVARKASDGSDNMSGDAELIAISGKET